MRVFLESCVRIVSRWSLLFVAVNSLYFGSVIVGALLAQTGLLPFYEWPVGEIGFIKGESDLLWMIVSIFFFNLVVSSFLLTTVLGLVFFIFPIGVLGLRALLWGALLNQLPTPQFLATFPTLILEGEGYVLAAVCGISLGLSWLKPGWAFKNRRFSRLEALKTALKECVRIYFLVMSFLFVAAVVEAVTIALLTS